MRTLESPISVRYSFLENEPLQLLVDTGWVGAAAIVAGLVLLVRHVWKLRRADRIELALVCGLVAVLVHSLVDFGLETLGVLLPLSVLFGAVLGRTKDWSAQRMQRRRMTWVVGAAVVGLVVGGVGLALPASADFDARLRGATTSADRRAVALRAEAAHPFDYFYVLQQAFTEPLIAADGSRSPRLSVLNRALLLCPNCPEVHAEIGRSLWSLGKRRQALTEWRTAAFIRPVLAGSIMEEVWHSGARPEEMATLAGGDPEKLVRIANLLLSKSDREAARKVLDSVPMGSTPSKETLLLRAELDIGDGKLDLAIRDLEQVGRSAPNEPRAYLLRAELAQRSGDVNGALDILDKGAAVDPNDLLLQDRRLRLIMDEHKWSRAHAAIDGLEAALFHAGAATTAVHTARAQLAAAMGESKTALSEFRAAINQDSDNAALWMNLAHYYESIWRTNDALKAMGEARQRAPQSPEIAQAIKQLSEQKTKSEESARSRLFLER